MASFLRIFKYVRPQWHRVLMTVMAAILLAILFAGSFATIIPMLKVMLGQEGLHGWVDRKICSWRYDIEFYVPDSSDIMSDDIRGYLLVADVDDDSKAASAGLMRDDRVVGVGRESETTGTNRKKLFAALAGAEEQTVLKIEIKRLSDETGTLEPLLLEMNTGENPDYIDKAIEISKWAIGFLPKDDSRQGKEKAAVFIILLMGAMTIVRCAARFCQQYWAEKIAQVAVAGLRRDAFAHTMHLPIGFFSKSGPSDTISRLIGDINGTGAGVKILLGKALREPLKAIACLVAAMMISWKLVVIFLCCAPVTFGLMGLLGKKMKRYTKRFLQSSALLLKKLEGAISALRVVKVYNRQRSEAESYQKINHNYLKQKLRAAKVTSATGPVMEVLGMIAGSAALLVGIHWITKGYMDPASFFALLVFLGTAAESIRKSSDVWNKIQTANAASERVFEVVDEPIEFENPNAIEIDTVKDRIEFRDVCFSYSGTDTQILKGLNLTVKSGHNIAIVGPNGSGKTTLVNLIPRFYNVDSGAILIDGRDIADCSLKSLRNQIGMVTQNVATFNETIAENIAYGRPGSSMEEIVSAAKRSFADEFIAPLPDGYDTIIGEQGTGLSGGQLQRIVIARAILKDPAILIFDEATSQVDANSEAKIHKAIEEIMKDRTSFIIAHRFSTVISADVIVVMDDGRIIAQGQHDELIKSCPLYQSLYETQLMVPE